MTNNTTAVLNPFEALAALDKKCKERAVTLPVKEIVADSWVGTGFRINNHYCVCSVGEINEIMLTPEMTRVPRAKPWVLGISNVRGSLLPIVDAGGYLLGKNSPVRRDSRVIVIRQENIDVGLHVDEVLGLQQFPSQPGSVENQELEAPFPSLTSGVYTVDGLTWWVTNILRLVEDKEFLQVAL